MLRMVGYTACKQEYFFDPRVSALAPPVKLSESNSPASSSTLLGLAPSSLHLALAPRARCHKWTSGVGARKVAEHTKTLGNLGRVGRAGSARTCHMWPHLSRADSSGARGKCRQMASPASLSLERASGLAQSRRNRAQP